MAIEVVAGRHQLGSLWLCCTLCDGEELLSDTGRVDVDVAKARSMSHHCGQGADQPKGQGLPVITTRTMP